MEQRWKDTDRGKPKDSEKNCASDTLPTTHPTWTDLGANPCLRGEKPVTNRLSYDMVYFRLRGDFIFANFKNNSVNGEAGELRTQTYVTTVPSCGSEAWEIGKDEIS
jgi:hypothetical protein